MPAAMRVAIHTSFDALDRHLQHAWQYPQTREFQFSSQWFDALARTGLPDRAVPRLYVIDGGADGHHAIMACAVVPGERMLRSLTSFYTTEYGVATSTAEPNAKWTNAAAQAFAATVAHERPRWDALELRLLRSDDPFMAALQHALGTHAFSVRRYFQFETWHTPTAGLAYDDYFASRPSQLRNTVGRRERKLRREHSVAIRVERHPGPGLDAAIAAFDQVYRASWKQPEPCPDFIGTMARTAARCGVLRLGVLDVDSVAAAAQLWLTTPHRATIYKLAYDERFRELSVGSVLSATMFRIALDEDKVAEIDYGVGSEPYKRDWMTAVRRAEGLLAHNLKTPRGLVGALRERAAVAWHQWRPRRTAPTVAADTVT